MTVPPSIIPDTTVRVRLLQAGLALFAARGYAATTVREIVDAAGVTKPVLYYHFGNKEGLYLAIIQESFTVFEGLLQEIVAAPGTARERLARFCRRIFDSAVANVAVVRLSYAIYFGPPQGAPQFDFEGFFQKLLEIIAAILDDGMTGGEFKRLPLHELTWAVMGILNVCMQEQICQSTPRIDGDGMDLALTILLNGIAAGESS